MKILICNLGIGGGGAEKVLVDLIKYWNNINGGGEQRENAIYPKRDIDLFLIERKKSDAYLSFVEENLHKVFSFPHIFSKVRFLNKFLKRRVLNNPKLINLFIKEQYDINLGFLEGISSIYISQKSGGKKIGYIHTSLYDIRDGKQDMKELEAYQRLDTIICVSKYAKTSLLKLYPSLEHKDIRVVYNPIDSAFILKEAREASPFKKTKFTFLQVGRLTYQKGLVTLLESCSILSKRGYEFEMWLLGEGERYKRELESIIEQENIKNIRFLGFAKNPYAVIKECDCMVLASYFEGYGLVLAEACVLGKAIIASDIPTSKEILEDENGSVAELFESKNANLLASSMERLINDKDYKAILESKALELAKKRDITKSVKGLESILSQR